MAATERRYLILSAYLTVLTVGCMQQPSIDAQTPPCTTASGSGGAYGLEAGEDTGAGTAVRQVTFYKDLLPILTANSGKRTYKCTTCHAHMKEPEGLNSVSKIEETIDSMTKGRMPRSNARVTPAEIKLFDLWRLQGFQAGDPSDTPEAEITGKPTATPENCAN